METCVFLPSFPYSPSPFPSCRSSSGNPTPILWAGRQVLYHWPATPLSAAIFEAICSSLEICRLLSVPYSKSITSVHVSVTKPMLKKSDGNILADAFNLIYTGLEKPCSLSSYCPRCHYIIRDPAIFTKPSSGRVPQKWKLTFVIIFLIASLTN